ncbi:MAG: choice-of-anchor D domain-containing protein [Prosthecobacter sp.]
MIPPRHLQLALLLLLSSLVSARAEVVTASYSSATDVPVTADGYTATGNTVSFALSHAPTTGAELMVVKNTGLGFISGVFDNLAQGQEVALPFGDTTYRFVANYHGGSGNDLVLVWRRNRVLGWGANNVGQLGDGTSTQRNLPVPVNSTGVLAGKTVLELVTGNGQSLALCSDGTVAAWGHNNYGQLGDNSVSTRNAPVAVNTTADVSALSGKRVVSVAAGYQHCLALCSDGTVAAWGDNASGQLGDNTTAQRLVPTAVNVASGVSALFGKTVVAVAAGSYHSMALCSDGTVAAWGNNTHGGIGDGTVTQRNAPVAVHMAPGSALFGKVVVAVAAGSWHNLALASDGTLAAWGLNSDGQCGIPIGSSFSIPTAVSTAQGDSALFGRTATAIAGGDAHSVVLCSDGVVATFGHNNFGQLGDNSTTARRTPVAMSAAEGVSALFGRTAVAVGAAYYNSMALCSDGSIIACGINQEGQVGDNSTIQRTVPATVDMTPLAPGERFIAITRGRSRSVFALAAAAPTSADIAIEQPAGTDIVSGGNLILSVPPGSEGNFVFTLKNLGDAHLNLTGSPTPVSLTGASEFSITAQPASFISAGSATTFTVRFAPADIGPKTATLSIPSNDPDESTFTINLIGAATTPPTDISLSPGSIPENSGANATVGTLTTDDPDVGDTATFTLVTGTGSTDNASFTITGASLILKASANFESKSSYTVRIRVTDTAGAFHEEPFTIAITDANEAPSFTKGANQSLLADATTPQSVAGWATALNDGDSVAVQSFTFNVSNDNNALFTVQPAVSSTGTLTFTPSGVAGIAIVTVTLTDDASINGTPALTTTAQTFTIVISGSTVSPVIRGVDTGATAATGAYTSQAIVNGHPAMSYYDSTNQNLMYVRALDANGTAWGAPVLLDATGNVGQLTSLAVVNGRPAISYHDVTNQDLKYVRAADADGAAWGTPVPVDTTGNVGSHSSLEVVNGRPAISYADTTNDDLRYVRALDADGAAWDTPLVLDATGNVGNFTSLAVVEGMPAISYAGGSSPGSLRYVRSSDAEGAAWGTPVVVASGSIGQHTSLQVVNGSPAISYYVITGGQDLRYVRATDTTGTTWGAPVTLDSVGTVGQFTSLGIVRGKPAISYYDQTNTALKYVRAGDVNGAVWETPIIVDNEATVGQYTSLAVVNGEAAISYYDMTNGDLKWAWLETVFVTPPEIAVQQPAGTDLPGGGSRDFGSVALGGSADLTFTILNTSEADLKLTGAPKVVISGSTDFSLTAQPASPVFGPTGSTTFSVRFAPTGSGARTATLTIANNDPDEGTYTLALTGSGLLSLNAWTSHYFGSATENIGPGDDFDSDGVVNLLEFAFGSNPASSANGGGPLSFAGNVISPGSTTSDVTTPTPAFLFVRRRDFAALGLTYTVQFSADLIVWETSAATPTMLADDGTNQVVGLDYPLMSGGAQAKFATVGVSVAP